MSENVHETRALSDKITPPPVSENTLVSLSDEIKLARETEPTSTTETAFNASVIRSGSFESNEPVVTQATIERDESCVALEPGTTAEQAVRYEHRRSLLRISLECDRLKFAAGRYRKGSRGDSNGMVCTAQKPENELWCKGHRSAPRNKQPLTKTQAIETLRLKAAGYRQLIAREEAKAAAPTVGGPSDWSTEAQIPGTTDARLRGALGQWCI